MFRRILQNLCFLARQCLALRGHVDGEDSNFTQLLRLRAFDCPEVTTWMDKNTNKYTSADVQSECLQVMALHILGQVGRSIRKNGVYTAMANECTDVLNKQFTVCIRWVDETLTDHVDVIGLRHVETIDTNWLVDAIKYVLLRMNLKLSDCRGQCYDGASNMTGCKRGVATQLQSEELRAVLTHCYGHPLYLAVGDAVKQSKVCQDALDLAYEISKLIRYCLKCNAASHLIKGEQPTGNEGSSVGI